MLEMNGNNHGKGIFSFLFFPLPPFLRVIPFDASHLSAFWLRLFRYAMSKGIVMRE
jgi:hypothetical protein